MAYSTTTQFLARGSRHLEEYGSYTFASGEISGPALSLPTKLKKVVAGVASTEDGVVCKVSLGSVSAGVVTVTRCGTWVDTTPTLHYRLYGY